jgi:uncharacterized ion transporter superfamily protein YfcC
LNYARKVKKNPQKSPVYNDDEYWRQSHANQQSEIIYNTPMSAWITYFLILIGLIAFSIFYPVSELKIGNAQVRFAALPILTGVFALFGFLSLRKSSHFFILLLLLMTIAFLIVGVMGYEWYIMEIGSLFFAMGILSGMAMGKSANSLAKLFLEGSKDILSAAVIVGLAGGIIIILQDGKVIDTILFSISSQMQSLGKLGTVSSMYGIQTVINLFMPSGSAKAALTMPIMAPFSDLIGLSRQATVMAYQFGDGFTNMITPTSGVLIAVLGVARIPFDKWFKWVLPLIIILTFIGWLLLIPTVTMRLNGF